MEENLLAVYNAVGGDSEFESIEEFKLGLQDPDNLAAVYNAVGGDAEFENIDEFQLGIGLNEQQETPSLLSSLGSIGKSSLNSLASGVLGTPQNLLNRIPAAIVNKVGNFITDIAEESGFDVEGEDSDFLISRDQVEETSTAIADASKLTIRGAQAEAIANSDLRQEFRDASASNAQDARARFNGKDTVELLLEENYGEAAASLAVDFVGSLPQLGIIAIGGPAGVAAVGATTATESTQDLIDEGVDESTATFAGGLIGMSEAIFEQLGTASIIGGIKESIKKLGKEGAEKALASSFSKIAGATAVEGGTEYATALSQAIIEDVSKDDFPKTSSEWRKRYGTELLSAALTGGVTGATLKGAGEAITKVAEKRAKNENNAENIEEVVEAEDQPTNPETPEVETSTNDIPSDEPAEKVAYDFDGTLLNNATGELTQLGTEIKEKIANGEDVNIITAREDTPENRSEIAAQLGIDPNKITLVGSENQNSKKAAALDNLGISRENFIDVDQSKQEGVRNGTDTLETNDSINQLENDLTITQDLNEGEISQKVLEIKERYDSGNVSLGNATTDFIAAMDGDPVNNKVDQTLLEEASKLHAEFGTTQLELLERYKQMLINVDNISKAEADSIVTDKFRTPEKVSVERNSLQDLIDKKREAAGITPGNNRINVEPITETTDLAALETRVLEAKNGKAQRELFTDIQQEKQTRSNFTEFKNDNKIRPAIKDIAIDDSGNFTTKNSKGKVVKVSKKRQDKLTNELKEFRNETQSNETNSPTTNIIQQPSRTNSGDVTSDSTTRSQSVQSVREGSSDSVRGQGLPTENVTNAQEEKTTQEGAKNSKDPQKKKVTIKSNPKVSKSEINSLFPPEIQSLLEGSKRFKDLDSQCIK